MAGGALSKSEPQVVGLLGLPVANFGAPGASWSSFWALGVLGGPWEVLGGSLGVSSGVFGGSFEGPWEVLGILGGSLGGPWGAQNEPQEAPGGSK